MSKQTIRRAKTRDVAFTYRMGAGFPGTVNRMHPASILPRKIDTTNPPLGYGRAVLANTSADSVRNPVAGDSSVTTIFGVAVRPYPTQQQSGGMTATHGSATPPVQGVIDVLRQGFIIVKCVGAARMGGAVHLWIAADSGAHVQGGFEAAATGGSTVALTNARFAGVPDADGYVELEVWPA